MSNRKSTNNRYHHDDEYGPVSLQQWQQQNGYAVTPTPAQQAKLAAAADARNAKQAALHDPEQWAEIKAAWNAAIASAQKQGLSSFAAVGEAIRATGYSLADMQLGKSIHG